MAVGQTTHFSQSPLDFAGRKTRLSTTDPLKKCQHDDYYCCQDHQECLCSCAGNPDSGPNLFGVSWWQDQA